MEHAGKCECSVERSISGLILGDRGCVRVRVLKILVLISGQEPVIPAPGASAGQRCSLDAA